MGIRGIGRMLGRSGAIGEEWWEAVGEEWW